MGVGGGGELAKVIFFNKESKSTKKNFCPFFLKGWGGGARLSDFLKRRKQI